MSIKNEQVRHLRAELDPMLDAINCMDPETDPDNKAGEMCDMIEKKIMGILIAAHFQTRDLYFHNGWHKGNTKYPLYVYMNRPDVGNKTADTIEQLTGIRTQARILG